LSTFVVGLDIMAVDNLYHNTSKLLKLLTAETTHSASTTVCHISGPWLSTLQLHFCFTIQQLTSLLHSFFVANLWSSKQVAVSASVYNTTMIQSVKTQL